MKNIRILWISFLLWGVFSSALLAQPSFNCLRNLGTTTQQELSWENPTACGTNDSIFIFFATNANGPYERIAAFGLNDNTTSFTYNYGSALDQFYFVQQFGADCSPSTINSDTLSSFPADRPTLIEMMLDNDGFVSFSWLPSPSSGVLSYEIRRQVPGDNSTLVVLDTIAADEALEYTDGSINHLVEPERYGYNIRPLTCSSAGDIQPLAAPFELGVANTSSDPCDPLQQLAWSANNSPWEIGYFVLNVETPGQVTRDTLPANANTTDIEFESAGIYRIQLFVFDENDNQVASSNQIELSAQSLLVSQIQTYNWTLNSNNNLLFTLIYTQNSDFSEVEVLGGDSPDNLSSVQSFNLADGITSDDLVIQDIPTDRQRFYQLRAVDVCDNEVTSNIFSVANIQVSSDNQNRAVRWTNLEGGNDFTRETVRLFKIIGSDTILVEDGVTGNSYDEPVTTEEIGQNVCFFLETEGTFVSFDGTSQPIRSRSNIACSQTEAAYYFPNAFAPTGVNRVFRPKTLRQTHEGYRLLIFDRFGKAIFESESFEQGWNGFIGERLAGFGVYTYLLEYLGTDGETNQQQGTVLLIK